MKSAEIDYYKFGNDFNLCSSHLKLAGSRSSGENHARVSRSVTNMAEKLLQLASALLVDYGRREELFGESFEAVKNHHKEAAEKKRLAAAARAKKGKGKGKEAEE